MDIVSRLKKFMEQENIAISQFADTCRIPRPTMSQILNGRNKKISDELISKIHLAYPDLSVLWLMFGEGDMSTNSNIRISEPQRIEDVTHQRTQPADEEANTLFTSQNTNCSENPTEKQSDNCVKSFTDYFTKSEEFQQTTQSLPLTATIDFMPDQDQANASQSNATTSAAETPEKRNCTDSNIFSSMENDAEKSHVADSSGVQSFTLPTSPNKRITNIVVFYSDNSFQSFTPSV